MARNIAFFRERIHREVPTKAGKASWIRVSCYRLNSYSLLYMVPRPVHRKTRKRTSCREQAAAALTHVHFNRRTALLHRNTPAKLVHHISVNRVRQSPRITGLPVVLEAPAPVPQRPFQVNNSRCKTLALRAQLDLLRHADAAMLAITAKTATWRGIHATPS